MAQRSKKPDVANQKNDAREIALLSDDPAGADEFAAKAHDQVAKAIAELVTTEGGGSVIGLEGTWGSGKSTVVRLLTQKLHDEQVPEGSPQTRAVIFDAWAHQDDPLRRSFLETVIKELESVGWLSEDDADVYRSKLAGKTSMVHTTTTSRLSLEGKLASAAAILLPLGAVLAANRFSHHHRFFLAVGAFLLVGPLLVVLGFTMAKVVGILASRNKPGGWRARFAALRPFGFFANQQDAEATTTGIEHGEPTSVEFGQLFSNVLSASLTDSRRLLLVLDNLDRVEPTEAKKVLATMQTFTSSGSDRTKPWTRCVWTLIPYDPDGLDRLWNPSAGDAEGTGLRPPLTTPTSAAFVEKVFQVRFQTPPLLLSDWRGYLGRLLTEALPEHTDEFDGVTRLRALYPGAEPTGLLATETATPRHLKQFVNQIGAIRRLRSDIPLVHIAYYTLLRYDGIDIAARLRAGELPHEKLKYLFKGGATEDLAAMYFGTSQELAQQLLLGGVLAQALVAGDAATVAELQKRPGFADALDSIDLGNLAGDGGIELTRAVAVLDEAGALAIPSGELWVDGALLPLARDVASWALSGRETGAGLAFLVGRLSAEGDSDLATQLAKIEIDPRESDTEGRLQLGGAAGLADGLIKHGSKPSETRIRVNVKADDIPSAIAFFGESTSEKESASTLELTCTPAEVTKALVDAASGDKFELVQPALDVLLTRSERVDLSALGSGCIEWLRTQDPSSGEQLDVMLNVLDLVRTSQPPEELLGPAADDGTLMHVVFFAQSNAWYAQAGIASMLHLSVRPVFPEPALNRNSAQGAVLVRQSLGDPAVNPEIVAQQLAWLQRHSTEAHHLLMQVAAADASFRPWVAQQLTGLWNASKFEISADQYVRNWKYLKSVLESDAFAGLTRDLLSVTAKRQAVIATATDPALAAEALDISTSGTEEPYIAELRTWGSSILRASSAAEWLKELGAPSGGPLLDLALRLAGTPEAPTDPPGLFDALHTHFQTLASGEAAWAPSDTDFVKLTSLLGTPGRKALGGELGAKLEGQDGQVGAELFATYGPFLATQKSFRTHDKLPGFVARALAHDAWTSVQWFVDLTKAHNDTLQTKGREDEIEHLRQQVGEKLAELDESPPESLSELSTLLAEKP